MVGNNFTRKLDESIAQRLDDVTARLQLVNRYNHLMGPPTVAVSALQRDFVMGDMTPSETSSFATLYRYILAEVDP
jgi:hypothetical protein